ncbi:hypothetical protein ACWGH8_39120 [Nonomuraea muscovyensis]|jgi:hypothetical protein|uniref:Uncharacterized protein n=1 Tax=Nonomuraea muscovyensis TaxID=1124761 RepID=A0A7X0C226_9ACTN|nr:hypothetical protein [Nonomuraea muscovyensis]MBB6346912.1 hypothetical protein [Nonomuraea muscovyensis]MDF2711948.1 hypothetical protein [Nonomuraea muscovyensis]
MDQTRKMWASAAVVGVIVVGGVSIAAAASAGRLDQVAKETRAVVEKASPSELPTVPGSGATQPSEQAPQPVDQLTEATRAPEDIVVSKEVNPDPGEVLQYWSDDRLEEAQPMPMPEVKPGDVVVGE